MLRVTSTWVTGTLPETFNEVWVFSKLLQTKNCASGSYCPDAFTQTPCPSTRPWSPINSSSLDNCTCLPGTFLNQSRICHPCTSSCNSLSGYYLPYVQCMGKYGATADAPCMPCMNIPASNAISTGNGYQLNNGAASGLCPFQCVYGTQLTASGGTGDACSMQYSCIRIAALPQNAQGQYLFYSGMAFPVDSFQISTSTYMSQATFITSCTTSKLLSNALLAVSQQKYSGWSTQPLSCNGQCNASNLQQLCYAGNASWIVDPLQPWYGLSSPVTCIKCPSPSILPSGAYVMGGGSGLSPSSCQANIRCSDAAYYFNVTAWQCQSCRARELQVCTKNNTRLRGQGCLNDFSKPFNTTFPSADCVLCNLSMPDAASTQGIVFLNYNAPGGCAMQACTPLASSFYWSQPCVGASPGLQAHCTMTDCMPWQYTLRQCSDYGDKQCLNCTRYKKGYKKTDECALLADTQWGPCTPGYYCNGNGSEIPCPVNKTSQSLAWQENDCYCNVGLRWDLSSGLCVPMQCPNTVQDATLPGVSLISTQYMTLDPQTLSSTTCMPCGSTALTRGNAVEVTSCACPIGFYAMSNHSQVICLSCAQYTTPICSDTLALPLPCSSLRTLDITGSVCKCAIAPFQQTNQVQSGASLCAASCIQPNFVSTGVPRALQGLPQPGGSAAYVPSTQTAWDMLVTSGRSISSVATTGRADDSVLSPAEKFHAEFLFWTLQGSSTVFASSICGSSVTAVFCTSLTMDVPAEWLVYTNAVDISGTQYMIAGIAVSRWNSQNSPLLYVAAVVMARTENLMSMILHVNSFNSQLTTAPWANTAMVSNVTIISGAQQIELVSVTHTLKGMGTLTSDTGGYFYIAYNQGGACGGLVLVSPLNPSQHQYYGGICDSKNSRIEALTVRIDDGSGYTMIYVVMGGGALYQINSYLGSLPATPMINAGSGAGILSFSPNLLLSIQGSTLQIADIMEWTWVSAIPGLPFATGPSLPILSVTGITPVSGYLVVAFQSSLFGVRLQYCSSLGQYWDGTQCVSQSCKRVTNCNMFPNQESVNGQCMCKAGYYLQGSICTQCTERKYCPGGGAGLTDCPSGSATVTMHAGSTSINDCICNGNGQYYSTLSMPPTCITCGPNLWCPNQWLSIPCPGTSSGIGGTTGNDLPYTCTCQAGFSGPSCSPCTTGNYCPTGTGATAVNIAVYYSGLVSPVASYYTTVEQTLLNYFTDKTTRVSTVNNLVDLQNMLYMQPVEATNRTDPGLMVMVQVPNQNLYTWATLLLSVLSTRQALNYSTLTITMNGPEIKTVPINPPTLCLTGKVPSSPIASTCVCAPGYQPSGQQCTPCPQNTFKAAAGSAKCAACQVGLVASSTGSTACSQPSNSTDGGNGNGSNNNTTMIIIGAAVGGVLVVVLLFYLVHSMLTKL